MTPVAALLTAIGLSAALIARRGISGAARRGGVAQHLRSVFTLTALLLGLRLVGFAWPSSSFVVACVMVAAAWLPLATLRLGEELVRHHAPRPLKLLALGGAIGFSLLAITLGLIWTREAILALAAFQGIVLAGTLVHLLVYRGSVAVSERKAADLLLLAFLIALPLLATDFQRLFPDLPFRGGPFAALVLMLACSRLATGAARPLGLLADIALALAIGGLAAAGGWLSGLDAGAITLVAALSTAGSALLLLVERFGKRSRGGDDILRAIAGSEPHAQAILAAHPLLAQAIPIPADQLASLPLGTVERLAAYRVITPGMAGAEDEVAGAASELLARHGATHMVRRSQAPPRFLAVCGGALEEEALTAQLDIVARLLESAP